MSKAVEYVRVVYYCAGCGSKGYEARMPATADEKKCAPVECARCNSTRFRAERIGKAAA